METFTIKDLTFTYPGKSEPALKHIDLDISRGEFAVLCGRSGCGKSTLLRNLKTVLAPHGERSGHIYFCGTPLDEVGQRDQASRIGYVLQNPDNQLVTDKVWHELAFGLENLGVERKTIRIRVAEMASFFGIQTWFDKNVSELSGGQKQILNLAAIMVMQPDVLILDEPTSQLDPIAAGDFLETVKKVNAEIGTTVILTEHRLEEVLPMADKAIVMDNGEIIANDIPPNTCARLAQMGHHMFTAMPSPLQAYAYLYREGIGTELECPMNVEQGRNWLTELFCNKEIIHRGIPAEEECVRKDEAFLELAEVWFKYGRREKDVIKDLSMKVYKGEIFCIVGGNGTGKTTALSLISGIKRPYRGKVKIDGKDIEKYRNHELFSGLLGVLPQNPQVVFVEKTVELDLYEMLEGKDISDAEKAEKVREVARLVEIEDILGMHPYDISGGEQQRAALAKILLLEPQLLLLDEPTKGLDNYFKDKFAGILNDLKAKGVTVVIVSHDVEFCAKYADRCAMFFDGNISTTNAPRKFFSGNSFYTTASNRMSRHIFENAVTAKDVAELCLKNLKDAGGDGSDPDDKNQVEFRDNTRDTGEIGNGDCSGSSRGTCDSEHCDADTKVASGLEARMTTNADAKTCADSEVDTVFAQKSIIKVDAAPKYTKAKKNIITVLAVIAMPFCIYAGIAVPDDRGYLYGSMIFAVCAVVLFVMSFERGRPQAREVIIIAVMVALAVAGRAAFFFLPQIKPIIAIVIIAGLCLGARSGFMVGALSAFVSNFIFGQGPWTLFQMLAWGLIGAVAGLLGKGVLKKKNTVGVVLFGIIACLLIHGFISDSWTVFSITDQPTWSGIIAVYSAGLIFNLILAVSTAVFLVLLTGPMSEKLDRIKMKYSVFPVKA